MATYGGPTWLQHPFVIEILLPFILVFTIVFAILQKSEIFGKGKRQIDSLVALVVGLLFISVGTAVGIINDLIPLLGVGLVIILILMILLASFSPQGQFFSEDGTFPKWLRRGLVFVVIIAVTVAVLWATGLYNTAYKYFSGDGGNLFINGIMIAVIVGAVIAVLRGGSSSGGGKENKEK